MNAMVDGRRKDHPKRPQWIPADDRIQTSVWLDAELRKRIGQAELDLDMKYGEIMAEAAKDWLRKKGY